MTKWMGGISLMVAMGLLIGIVIVPAIAQGGEPDKNIPTSMSYQGFLTDDNGDPITDPVDLTFTIYTSGGTPVWAEKHSDVQPSNGLFNVELGGNGSPMATTVFDGDRYLGIQVDNDPEMNPRQKITSVGYALVAEQSNNSNALDGLDSKDILKQDIYEFVVGSGSGVTAGDVVSFVDGYVEKGFHVSKDIKRFRSGSIFNPTQSTYISTTALSETKFVVAYLDYHDYSYYGTVIVGDISDKAISYGSEYVFNAAQTADISIDALSDSKIVIAYRDSGNSEYGTAVIGEISDLSITFGSEYVFHSGRADYAAVSALSDTKFVVAFRDNANSFYGTAIIGDISGTVISYGSEYVFNADAINMLDVTSLSNTQFSVIYQDTGNGNYGTSIIGNVSGTVISYGSEYVFNAASTSSFSIDNLTNSKFVVAYRDFGNSDYGTVIIGDVSGTTISYGSEHVFNSEDTSYISIAALSDSKFAVAFQNKGNSNYGTIIIGDVSGTGVSYGSQYVFDNADTSYLSVAAISECEFVVTYYISDISKGFAVIGELASESEIIGIAQQSKSAGETVPVIIGGISDVHSGLVSGEAYYIDSTGNLTSAIKNYGIGTALSETELLLQIEKDWND